MKAASETDAAVGDKANDAIRVNGGELRCKVIGEGGNLGATQLGRIEFALKGGKVSTPTPSTTRAAWIVLTTRSTSRSCSTAWWPKASSPRNSATSCLPT